MLKCKFSRCLLVVLCLLFAGNIFAMNWDELKSKIEAKYATFSDEIKDMEMVMESETKGMEDLGPSEIKMFRKGDKYRIETKMNVPEGSGMPAGMGDMKNIMIFDGKDLWTINQFTGKQKLSSDVNAVGKDQMNWWKDMPKKGKIIGSEKVGDRDCYVVEASNEDIDTSSIRGDEENKIKGWIEKETFLLVQMEFQGAKEETFKVVNSNFKKVKQWEIPYKTEVFTGGKLISENTIKTLDINKGLSDDLFDVDKASEDVKTVPGMPDMKEMMKKFKMGG
jgi:outer membrane lipoprotein-sorting protein